MPFRNFPFLASFAFLISIANTTRAQPMADRLSVGENPGRSKSVTLNDVTGSMSRKRSISTSLCRSLWLFTAEAATRRAWPGSAA